MWLKFGFNKKCLIVWLKFDFFQMISKFIASFRARGEVYKVNFA